MPPLAPTVKAIGIEINATKAQIQQFFALLTTQPCYHLANLALVALRDLVRLTVLNDQI